MLTELRIANFAIIEEQLITFAPGLNVISGETGSGKSIILNALELILGARPRPHFIRAGADSLEIEAHFDLSRCSAALLEQLPDVARGRELLISRSMNRNGKGRVQINGRLGSVALLEEISQKIITLCSQGQQIRLLEPKYHLELVDSFAANDTALAEYQNLYRVWRGTVERLARAEQDWDSREARRAELAALIEELQRVAPRAGLRDELEERVRRLEGGERIIGGLTELTDGISQDGGARDQLSTALHGLSELARVDRSLAPYLAALQATRTGLDELIKDLEHHAAAVEIDEELLAQQREQLAELARIERKYRSDASGLAAMLERSVAELAELDRLNSPERLRAEEATSHATAQKAARTLSSRRRKAAEQLSAQVGRELAELNMPDAELRVEMEERAELGADGIDSLELIIATNKGEPFKPLRQVASGGELSRIMLVLKKSFQERSGVNVLIFDEVDSGISGGVARAVGEKLRAVAQHSQVICITHLPQVASLADHHLLVDKVVGDRTVSIVKELSSEEKVNEIARMLAGFNITETARESARELLSSKT